MLEQYRQIVAKVREQLAGGDVLSMDELETLNDQLIEALRGVVERLNTAREFLARGHRAVAQMVCSEAPPVFDLIAILDVPELNEWRLFVGELGLHVPPEVPRELAEEVKRGLEKAVKLTPLLTRWRRANLRRKPLADRLEILRQLVKHDPENAAWLEDLRAHEAARLDELAKELDVAEALGDLARVRMALHELELSPWKTAVPERLLQKARIAERTLTRQQAVETLRFLLPEVQAAYNSNDAVRAISLWERWKAAMEEAALRPDDPLMMRARPFVEWMEEHDRQERQRREVQAALFELERSLVSGADLDVIRDLVRRATRYGHALPRELAVRVHQREKAAQAAELRRRVILGTIIGAAALSLVGFGAWVAYRVRVTGRAERLIRQVNRLIEEGRPEDALELLERTRRLDPAVFREGTVQNAYEKVQSMVEDRRRKLQTARGTLDAVRAHIRAGTSQSLAEAERLLRGIPRELQVLPELREEIAQARFDLESARAQLVEHGHATGGTTGTSTRSALRMR